MAVAMAIAPDSADWLEVERALALKENEMLRKQGVKLPEEHLLGYQYAPQRCVVDKQAWDVLPVPNRVPKCTSANWKYSDVEFEVGQGIAYITLNRPQANNALSDDMIQGVHDACFELHRRTDVRIVVLRAEGKMFCAGGDPKSFQDTAAMTDKESKAAATAFMRLLYFIQGLPQFTIALVQGSTMGTGLGLLAACDTVCAVSAARFVVSEVKLGMCPATIIPIVTAKIGPAHAKRVFCLADTLSAATARRIGLVTDVVEDESDFSKYVEAFCDKITLCAPTASARSKRLVQNVSARPLSAQLLSYTGGELASIRVGDEAVKGMAAVQARERPPWAVPPIKPLY